MSEQTERKSLPWRRRLVFVLLAVIGASIAARILTSKESGAPQPVAASQTSGSTPAPGSAFLPGTTPAPLPTPEDQKPEEQSPAQDILPYLTEGGIAMLIGIALGMATRTVARVFILLVAVFFIGVQFLAAKGIVNVDWSAFTTWLRQFVLNISGENGLGAIVQHKLPSAGSLVLGYYIGLKKG